MNQVKPKSIRAARAILKNHGFTVRQVKLTGRFIVKPVKQPTGLYQKVSFTINEEELIGMAGHRLARQLKA